LAGVIALAWAAHDMGEEKQLKRDQPVIAKLNTDLADCKATLVQQSSAMQAQNAAITQLGVEAQQRADAADAAIRKAQDEARVYRARAAAIAKRRSGPDQCSSAKDLIVEVLSEERDR
jgi:hypothetical protein